MVRRRATALLMLRVATFRSCSAISLTPVQETSLLVAYWRHLETAASNGGLIQDLPAGDLVQKLLPQERIKEFRNNPICSCGQDILAVRTRCIDDWLYDKRQDLFATRNGERRQLVNLGAGMCARYYRLNELTKYYDEMWEVDSDMELLNIKKAVLDETVSPPPSPLPINFVEGDLASNSLSPITTDLLKSSFEASKPTDWIVEGVLEYLDPTTQHGAILDFTSSLSAPGSRMVLQVLEEPLRDYFFNTLGAAEALPWQELPTLETFVKCAHDFGWDVERCVVPSEWKGLYNRDLSHVPGFNMIFLTRKR